MEISEIAICRGIANIAWVDEKLTLANAATLLQFLPERIHAESDPGSAAVGERKRAGTEKT
jgi:hypothetical protein